MAGKGEEGSLGIHVALLQGKDCLDDQAYLHNCPTATAFKSLNFLTNIETQAKGMKMNCNAGAVKTNQKCKYGKMAV